MAIITATTTKKKLLVGIAFIVTKFTMRIMNAEKPYLEKMIGTVKFAAEFIILEE
jgi:hypothetical protein